MSYEQLAVDLALTEYGLQRDGHRLLSCGSHTGHTVKDMALAISPEVADFISRSCNSHHAMVRALKQAATQFRSYEQQHLAKGTTEGDEKARTNARYAALCEAAIPQTPASPEDSPPDASAVRSSGAGKQDIGE